MIVKSFGKYNHLFTLNIFGYYIALPWTRLKYAEYKDLYRCIFHQKGYSVGETARETKPSPTPFFSHFTQLSPPPIAKWESLSSYLFPFLKVLFLSLQTMAFRAKVISRCIFQSHNAWLWNTVKPELQNHTAKNI